MKYAQDRPALSLILHIVIFARVLVGAELKNDDTGIRYGLLDRYLRSYILNAQPESNLRAAENLMKSTSRLNNQFGLAIKQFVALPIGDRSCNNREVSKALRTIDQATRGLDVSFIPRISEVIRNYRIEHSLNCRQIYLERFVERYEDENLNGLLVGRVETLIDDFIMRDFQANHNQFASKPDKKQDLYDDVIKESDINLKEVIKLETIRQAMMRLASRKDPINRISSQPPTNDSKELYQVYVIKPCDYYVSKFGPDLFDSVKSDVFDTQQHENDTDDEDDFYFGWARYRLCRYLLDNRDSISRQLGEKND